MKTSTEFSLILTAGGMIIVTGAIKLAGRYTGIDLTHLLRNKYYWIGIFLFSLGVSIIAHFWHRLYPKFVKRIDEADTVRRSRGNCYYYIEAETGIEEGPVTIPQIKSLVASGRITPRTLVRKARSSKTDLRPAKHFRDITEIGRQYGEKSEVVD